MQYDFSFCGETGHWYGLRIVRRPDIPAPEEDVEEYDIPGRGVLMVRKGTYRDIVIPMEANFREKPELWADRFRKCKRWLLGPVGKLKFSDDYGKYYQVKRVLIMDAEREVRRIGRFTAEFTCAPYQYLEEGDQPRAPEEVSYNPYEVSRPAYQIVGEGVCTLTVNGKTVTANVGQNLTIDTERMISYRQDGEMMNTAIAGDYEDLYLLKGENTIAISAGFTLSVVPKWRVL